MSDCSKHKKEIAGISDPKAVARIIVDSHYEWQAELWLEVSRCYQDDGIKDFHGGRTNLSSKLFLAKQNAYSIHTEIEGAWQISKPFMNNKQ